MPADDLRRHREPRALASASPAPETPARPRRGHAPKLAEAVAALRADRKLPPNLRPSHRDKRIQDWLTAAGYGNDLPDRTAIRRYFQILER
jgi:hypothetical protein